MNSESLVPVQQSNSPAAMAAAQMQKSRFESAYTIAKKFPRSIDQVRQNILRHCQRPRFAEKVEYSKPAGGDARIKGPTIRFAEMAIRELTNVFSDIQVIYDDKWKRQIKVILCDLETNCQFTKEITINKTVERKSKEGRQVLSERKNSYGKTVYLVVATEDELLNKENALISKAIRNEGLRLIPQDIIEEAMDVAKATLRESDSKDPDEAKRRLIDSFFNVGVKVGDLAEYIGHSIDQITPKELEDLRKMYTALSEGSAKWSDYVQSPTDLAKAKAKLKAAKEAKKSQDKPAAKLP